VEMTVEGKRSIGVQGMVERPVLPAMAQVDSACKRMHVETSSRQAARPFREVERRRVELHVHSHHVEASLLRTKTVSPVSTRSPFLDHSELCPLPEERGLAS